MYIRELFFLRKSKLHGCQRDLILYVNQSDMDIRETSFVRKSKLLVCQRNLISVCVICPKWPHAL